MHLPEMKSFPSMPGSHVPWALQSHGFLIHSFFDPIRQRSYCGVAGPPFIYCGGMSSSKLDRPKKLLPAFSPWATAASCRLSAAGQCQPETAVRGIWVTAEISEWHAVVYSVSWKYALLLQARKGWKCLREKNLYQLETRSPSANMGDSY